MFLPVSKDDMMDRNIDQLDFIIISGDAYVDHPSFGVAIISRLLERHGYTVGIIPQPDMKNDESFIELGENHGRQNVYRNQRRRYRRAIRSSLNIL